MPDDALPKLRDLLEELFQLNHADLDFGIYRVMNVRAAEIRKFLDQDFLPQVRSELQGSLDGQTARLNAQLQGTISAAMMKGGDIESDPDVAAVRAALASLDLDRQQRLVLSDLFQFFRRYYSDGDFLSQRRYGPDRYAIPYNGEEVKLHWANHDQYYIKSSESFRDYAFTVTGNRRVHFRLVDADVPKDNVKANAERRFLLAAGDEAVADVDGELICRFEYWPDELGRKRDVIDAANVERILALAPTAWANALAAPRGEQSTLAFHLNKYTAKNSFDYFIHKRLGDFLRGELDHYIKHEVLHLDDVGKGNSTDLSAALALEATLSRIRCLRRIADKLIAFLAQIEDFQKRLWLKRKFVVGHDYLVTIDRVDPSLRDFVAANPRQWAQWEAWGVKPAELPLGSPDWATRAYLDANDKLVVDTRLFGRDFVDALLANDAILNGKDSLDAASTGVLFHSENFQALTFMQPRYAGQVKCVYIDPPYNTGGDGFVYKDSYQHSSWLTAISNRVAMCSPLLTNTAIHFVSLDDNEIRTAATAIEADSSLHFVTSIIWQKVDSPNDNKVPLTPDHEYILLLTNDPTLGSLRPMNAPSILDAYNRHPETGKLFRDRLLKKNGANSMRSDRPTMFYPLRDPDGGDSFPIHDDGREACWALGKASVIQLEAEGRLIWKRRTIGGKERWEPYTREFAPENPTRPYPTIWDDVNTMRQAKAQIKSFFAADQAFSTPKPVELLQRLVQLSNASSDVVLDYFAGSGTTAHAVINLNREDAVAGGTPGERKFVLVEMGEHFDGVLVPRVAKVLYSPDWRDGSAATHGKGTSGLVKLLRLEGYEDTLANLRLDRSKDEADLLTQQPAFREAYTLGYLLNHESRHSLLDVTRFADPFAWTLQVAAAGNAGETRATPVDLVETFNWLLGLRVEGVQSPSAGLRVVTGTSPEGERVLVIWRRVADWPNESLEKWLDKRRINPRDMEYDVIYVNGDHGLENVRTPDDRWKVRLIEEDFARLMFDVKDV